MLTKWNVSVGFIVVMLLCSNSLASTFHFDVGRSGNFTDYGPKNAELVYKLQLTGFVDGSPVVWNGNVYLTNNPGMGGSEQLGLYSINATNGSIIWKVSDIYSMATPAVSDSGYLFVHAYDNSTGNGVLYSFYASNGTERWNITIEPNLSWWQSSSSPLVYNNRVYVLSYDGILYAFDFDGNELWNVSSNGINKQYFSSPSAGDGLIFYSRNESGTYYLAAVNETGVIVWKKPVNGTIVNTPAVSGGRVYIATDTTLYAFNTTNGTELWNISFNGTMSTPAIAGNRLYIGSKDGKLYCFNASTGQEIWNFTAIQNPSAWDSIKSSPAYADNVIYFGTNEVNGKVFALNASNGSRIWEYEVNQYIMSSPFIYRGKLFIGADDGNLYIFGLWKGTVTLTPGTFNVTADDGRIYAVSNLTALGALQKASEIGGFSYTVNESYGGGNLYPTSIGRITNGWWMYEVNGIMPMNGTNVYNVSDGDTVVYWLWTSFSDSASNTPNTVIINVHTKNADINSVTVTNGVRGGNATAYVNITSYVSDWFAVVVSGTNSNGDSLAGVTVLKLSQLQTVEVPVVLPIPLQAQTGNYNLYVGVYRLNEYPNNVAAYTTIPVVCGVS